MLITLTLLIALAQQPEVKPPVLPPDHQVALALSETTIVFLRLDDAQRLYRALERGGRLPRRLRVRLANGDYGLLRELVRTADEARVHAALTVALGTLPEFERLTAPGLPGTRKRLDWEVRRGVRKRRAMEQSSYRDY